MELKQITLNYNTGLTINLVFISVLDKINICWWLNKPLDSFDKCKELNNTLLCNCRAVSQFYFYRYTSKFILNLCYI